MSTGALGRECHAQASLEMGPLSVEWTTMLHIHHPWVMACRSVDLSIRELASLRNLASWPVSGSELRDWAWA